MSGYCSKCGNTICICEEIMSEIKIEPYVLKTKDNTYVVFGDEHTIADILRYAASQADWQEIVTVAEIEMEEEDE